jgi:LPXTG-motif cell wall-anchored protein
MSGASPFLVAGLVFAIFMVAAILVLWRRRRHLSTKADAEARMAQAMHELQVLTARLQAERSAAERRGAAAGDGPSGGAHSNLTR